MKNSPIKILKRLMAVFIVPIGLCAAPIVGILVGIRWVFTGKSGDRLLDRYNDFVVTGGDSYFHY